MSDTQNQDNCDLLPVKLHFNTKNLTGQRFGSFTVKAIGKRFANGAQPKWECVCDCGSVVFLNQTQITLGRTEICNSCVSRMNDEVCKREHLAISMEKRGRVKHLPSQPFLLECFTYDPATGLLTWKERPIHHFASELSFKMWNAHYAGKTAGRPAVKKGGGRHAIIVKIGIGAHHLSFVAHRVIYALLGIDVPEGMEIDHADRNPYNNAKGNLRIATSCQNGWNSGVRRRKHDLPKGVFKVRGGFQPRIRRHGVERSLGYFKCPIEAGEAYAKAALEYDGEFFCANR